MTIEAYLGFSGGTATLHLAGESNAADVAVLLPYLRQVTAATVNRLVLRVAGLDDLPAAALRALAVTAQSGATPVDVIVVQPSGRLTRSLERAGLASVVTVTNQA